MNGKLKLYTLLIALIAATGASAQDTPNEIKILVVGLDTLQFSSNVFYLDELAYYNDTGEYDVVELYNQILTRTIGETHEEGFNFVIADSADAATVHATSVFINTKNEYGDEFVGIAPAEGDGGQIIEMMQNYKADYILFLNAYQIYHKNPPENVSYDIRANHIIHFDIFTNQLTSVYGGKMELPSSAVEAFLMRPQYRKFALNAVKWIKAYNRSLQNRKSVRENFELLQDEMYIEASGLSAMAGLDSPYGLLGISFSRFIERSLEPNIGMGFGFSGFSFGAGANYYFHNALPYEKLKPFIGLYYSFASGNKFEIGGQKDDYGNPLNPADISRYKIHAEHFIQLQGGVSYWMSASAVSLSVGYGYPFRDKRPEFIGGKESKGRMNLVEAFTPGGLAVSIKYMLFINSRFMTNYRFW